MQSNNTMKGEMLSSSILGGVLRFGGMLTLAGAVACGGGSESSKGGTTAAKSDTGAVLKTGGATVSEAAHNHWREGNVLFAKAEASGWTESACDDVEDKFEEANDAQRGAFGEAIYMLGLTAERCGDQDEAWSYYEKAMSADPKLCKARVGVGLKHLKQGRKGQARTEFQTAIKNDSTCASGYANLAILQREVGGEQEKEALNNLRRALAIESDYMPALNQMAMLYYARAKAGGKERGANLDLAEIVCQQATRLEPKYAPIYNTWGLIKTERGNVTEALKFFERAIKLDPKIFEAQMNFGQVTLAFRGYTDAHKSFTKAVELRPKSYEAQLGLGAALRGLEKYDAAQQKYEAAMALDSSRPEAYYNLGLIFQDYKNGTVPEFQRASKFYDEFLSRAKGKERYAKAVKDISARCSSDYKKRKRLKQRCGRKQTIQMTIDALKEAEEMQREAEKMEREAAAQQQGQ